MSQIIPIFRGVIENGHLDLKDKIKFASYLNQLKGEVEVIIRKIQKHRSLEENSYYWGVIVNILSDELGFTKQEIHEVLKTQFLSKEVQIKGKMYKIIKSTTDLSTLQMEEYLENIRQWALIELQINIPLPNEVEVNL